MQPRFILSNAGSLKIGGHNMAIRNNLSTNLWQKVQKDSVSWGSLALWIGGLIVVLAMLTIFSKA
jgi:hypothetical protein